MYISFVFSFLFEKFEDTKAVIKSRKYYSIIT